MMNKCAKFHEHSLNGKKDKFHLPSTIELSETGVFVYNFVWNEVPDLPLSSIFKEKKVC